MYLRLYDTTLRSIQYFRRREGYRFAATRHKRYRLLAEGHAIVASLFLFAATMIRSSLIDDATMRRRVMTASTSFLTKSQDATPHTFHYI